jgi:hypothetical protein
MAGTEEDFLELLGGEVFIDMDRCVQQMTDDGDDESRRNSEQKGKERKAKRGKRRGESEEGKAKRGKRRGESEEKRRNGVASVKHLQ